MSIIGWYYLHANGDLIYKPGIESIADIRESDLCRCAWPMAPSDREGAWNILVEGLALGAKPARVIDLATKWQCFDDDADVYAERIGVRVYRDGNAWCAVGPGFVDIQESPAGFGETKLEAIANLAKELKVGAGKTWRRTFKDILSDMAKAGAK